MPPTDRFVISFAAEPPQQSPPDGAWAEALREQFVAACREIHADEELGEPGEISWFPDRTYAGRTYVPGVARTAAGYELFGYVSFAAGQAQGDAPAADHLEDGAPVDFEARADFTGDVAESNPDWQLDLNSWTIAGWRGEGGRGAEIALVWGVPLVGGGAIVTGELANLAVDQCELVEQRFTLVAPDGYRGDYLEVKLWDRRGRELAVESLYEEDDSEANDSEANDEQPDAEAG